MRLTHGRRVAAAKPVPRRATRQRDRPQRSSSPLPPRFFSALRVSCCRRRFCCFGAADAHLAGALLFSVSYNRPICKLTTGSFLDAATLPFCSFFLPLGSTKTHLLSELLSHALARRRLRGWNDRRCSNGGACVMGGVSCAST